MAPKSELSENEKQIYDCITKGNEEEVKRLLGEKDVHVDCLDEHGMTPLQHAAYKGNKGLCELLLAHGANVNCNEHEYGYTALMFAGLSGNVDVVKLMLAAGARTSATNSVGRTASQMAAFVGQHHCVSVINNYFDREDLEYYSIPHGLETESKLPIFLVPSLHKFILMNNLNPIRLLMFLEQNPELIEHAPKIVSMLELLCDKQIKQNETNDILSFKMHYLAYLIRSCHKHLEDKNQNESSTKEKVTTTLLDSFKKVLLKGREIDGFPVNMEIFLRQGIREFPYHECALLQQIVRNLAPVKVGDEPTALNILMSAINGQHHAYQEDSVPCTTCGDSKSQKCSACKMVSYCNPTCQKLDWPTHKRFCKKLALKYKKQQELIAKREIEEKEAAEKEKAINQDNVEDQSSHTESNSSEKLESDTSEEKISEDKYIENKSDEYKYGDEKPSCNSYEAKDHDKPTLCDGCNNKDCDELVLCDSLKNKLVPPLDAESIQIEC